MRWFLSPKKTLLLCHYTSFSVCSNLWLSPRTGWTAGATPNPRPVPRPVSPLALPPFAWLHLDGWLSFLSRGNSTETAASSSCVSTSVLIERLESRAWNWAWEISCPRLPPSVSRCLNHSEGERGPFSSPDPPSFLLYFFHCSNFQASAWAWFSSRLSHQDHFWINLVPGQTFQFHTFIPWFPNAIKWHIVLFFFLLFFSFN